MINFLRRKLDFKELDDGGMEPIFKLNKKGNIVLYNDLVKYLKSFDESEEIIKLINYIVEGIK